MERSYNQLIKNQLRRYRQMIFISGPRQVGKTTCSLMLKEEVENFTYLNWDVIEHRDLITGKLSDLADEIGISQVIQGSPPMVIFDEIHKYTNWKTFLKGFFDLYADRVKIVVTGSARLDVYRAGGDSMMGRYFLYRMHPLTIAEVLSPSIAEGEWRPPQKLDQETFDRLVNFGGFPQPFASEDHEFLNHWRNLRYRQVFQEDLRDLSRIHELSQVEVLARLILHQAGQLTPYSQLAKKVGVTVNTVKNWLSVLESLFYCFSIRPWSRNISRSLLKEPKYYLYDWSLVDDPGAKAENFVASHLLKAVHFWTDRGLGRYDLHFLRDRDKREVDFLITKNDEPYILVECKKSNSKQLSPALTHFQQQTQAPYAFQVVLDMDYIEADCFSAQGPVIVPALTFLSQLV